MRVLIADDKVWLRSALRLLLEHEGNIEVVGEVASATSLASVMPYARPNLLFLDWQLPGLETNWARHRLTETLRLTDPALLIIALADDNTAKSCLHLGADACINRAESPDRIMSTVRQAATRLAVYQAAPSRNIPLQ